MQENPPNERIRGLTENGTPIDEVGFFEQDGTTPEQVAEAMDVSGLANMGSRSVRMAMRQLMEREARRQARKPPEAIQNEIKAEAEAKRARKAAKRAANS